VTIPSGTKLDRYEIRSKLGAGGMGEVYLAEDARLHRKVALKILPADLASNKDRMRRFEQEAQSAAALNHPNIAHIYEIGEADGVNFIAMEFIDGLTLRELIHGRQTALSKLLRNLQHAAEGLAKAHAAGIVHRDLKPDNIMITREGHAKILDFGLAKLIEQRPTSTSAEGSSEVATAVMPQDSTPGTVMGTIGYMSPEQAQGKTNEIDQRSDIFSFGCILFEAVTGRKPFEGESVIKSLHMVVYESAPAIADLNPSAPPELQRIVRRCLAKDPEERYQSIKEVAIELKELRRELQDAAPFDTTVLSSRDEATSQRSGDAASGTVSAASTQVASAKSTASGVEYIAGGIKRHKLTVLAGIFAVIATAIGLGFYLHARNTEVAIESIAVLPFVNQNHDADSDYLSDGVTESIINSLTQLPNLKVIARSSVFHYKGKESDPLTVGKELGVRAVLTGRITQRGDNIIISSELTDVRDNKQLWGEQYERKASDLMSLQRDIASQIANNLRLKISGEEHNRMMKHYTENPEAYQAYLKGRYYWNKRTEAGLKKGIEYFQQAVDQDPTYALAYTGLADSYSLLPFSSATPTSEVAQKARAAAARAIELDPDLAEAHASRADVMELYDWDFSGSEREFQRAIELNPNYATAHHWYANLLDYLGRPEEAKREILRAHQLDPLSLIISHTVGGIFLDSREYDGAIEQFKRTLEIDPNFPLTHQYLGLAYGRNGKYDDAITEMNKAIALAGRRPVYVASLGYIHALSGKTVEANKLLEELMGRAKTEHVSSYDIASVYAGLGDRETAFAWLEKAVQERDLAIVSLKVDLYWERLRDDVRFADLLRRVGLSQ
jgi:serine/threonine protein kinase/Flp pilus assembly protein TadD